jgi:anti-anti-sigma regulatory factor
LLDLGGVRVPTAGGVGRLVALHTRLRASGGRLVLCNVGQRAFEVFELTRLTELLDVRPAGVDQEGAKDLTAAADKEPPVQGSPARVSGQAAR